MGGGNAQKSAISRARNAEKMAKVKKGGSALLPKRNCFGLCKNSGQDETGIFDGRNYLRKASITGI